MGKTINVFLALCDDILNGLTGMDLEEKVTGVAIFILLIYYDISKDKALDKKMACLRKEITSNIRTKGSGFHRSK